ncbi:hypothetical protein [Actinomadura rudentiformis]|uniref:Uncharacterized protein n=1 Tax=Actinomadura rudentiformis TaxID=359158 RepID=A0A6H9Z4Y8_9ACTN|nr:hypothetical protein [Actinomadura rudentiformis]KAB2349719.1 hypothetical protein F8566_13290 [Actinomadura rudentiformis]
MSTAKLIGAAVAAGLLVPLAPGAGHAAASAPAQPTAQSAASPAVAAHPPLPRCVKVWKDAGHITRTGYAKNTCRKSYRIKFVWRKAPDSSCQRIKPGQTLKSKRSKIRYPGDTLRVVRC